MSDQPTKKDARPIVKFGDSTCPTCGKSARKFRKGSLTSWIFSETRCKCSTTDSAAETIKVPDETITNEVTTALSSAPELAGQAELDKESKSIHEEQQANDIDLGPRYNVISRLGEGGSGVVYKVFDNSLNLTLAVKILREEIAKDAVFKQRFQQEAELATTLAHENLVGMYGHDETPHGTPFILMQYLEGRTLERLLIEEGQLSEERFKSIFYQVLQGLSHAHHRGLIHRDIKPSNIVIVEHTPGIEIVKLIDFGIAKMTELALRTTHNLTQTGEVFGTPAYMSPEQCLGFEVDARSDIYSLGCVMYEALTGRPPFQGKNPVQIISKHLGEDPTEMADVGPNISSLVFACLEKDVDKRPETADKLAQEFNLLDVGRRENKTAISLTPIWRYSKSLFFTSAQTIVPELRAYYAFFEITVRLGAFASVFVFPAFLVINRNPRVNYDRPELVPLSYIAQMLCAILWCHCAKRLRYVQQVSKIVSSFDGIPCGISAVQKTWRTQAKVILQIDGETFEKTVLSYDYKDLQPGDQCLAWVKDKQPIAIMYGKKIYVLADRQFLKTTLAEQLTYIVFLVLWLACAHQIYLMAIAIYMLLLYINFRLLFSRKAPRGCRWLAALSIIPLVMPIMAVSMFSIGVVDVVLNAVHLSRIDSWHLFTITALAAMLGWLFFGIAMLYSRYPQTPLGRIWRNLFAGQ